MRLQKIVATSIVVCGAMVAATGCAGNPSNASRGDDGFPTETLSAASDAVGPGLGDAALGPQTNDFVVLVVGDSLARSIGEGMADVAPANNIKIINAAIGGCGLLLPLEQRVNGKMGATDPKCNEWPVKWPELVAEYHPDAVYLSTSFWDAATQVIDSGGDAGTLADIAFQDRWVENATLAIDSLTADGARVFLDDMNSDGLHGVQQAAVAQIGPEKAAILPLAGQICDVSGCPQFIKGVRVMDDTGHPAEGESRDRLARWMLNQMAQGIK